MRLVQDRFGLASDAFFLGALCVFTAEGDVTD